MDGNGRKSHTLRNRGRVPQTQQTSIDSQTSSIKIRETSPNGTHLSTHTLTSTSFTTHPAARNSPDTTSTTILQKLLTPFLPTNYPHSVTPDYTPYQIYDSLQALASTIAGLLASRAVLTSLGYGTESNEPNSTATAVTLVSIIQNSIGQFATIFFAHYFALRIEAEVKFYRFLADIVNDAAFILDVLSPSLPTYARVPTLCVASVFRSICGVCGGSSKAILSAHFAQAGNIGELNAKDGSQETVVSLVGMWIGGIVVSRVEGREATWLWMVVLLVFHLWANWMAVRSVRLKTLNCTRAGMVFGRLLGGKGSVRFEDIGREEGLFESGGRIKMSGQVVGYCSFGGLRDQMALFYQTADRKTEKESDKKDCESFARLLSMFKNEQYVLWLDPRPRHCVIVLKDQATAETEVQAWAHAFRLTYNIARYRKLKDSMTDAVLEALVDNLEQWDNWTSKLEAAGWDVPSSNLAFSSGSRIQLSESN